MSSAAPTLADFAKSVQSFVGDPSKRTALFSAIVKASREAASTDSATVVLSRAVTALGWPAFLSNVSVWNISVAQLNAIKFAARSNRKASDAEVLFMAAAVGSSTVGSFNAATTSGSAAAANIVFAAADHGHVFPTTETIANAVKVAPKPVESPYPVKAPFASPASGAEVAVAVERGVGAHPTFPNVSTVDEVHLPSTSGSTSDKFTVERGGVTLVGRVKDRLRDINPGEKVVHVQPAPPADPVGTTQQPVDQFNTRESRAGAGLGRVAVVSSMAGRIDAFVVGNDCRVHQTSWTRDDSPGTYFEPSHWTPWVKVADVDVAPCAPISAIASTQSLVAVLFVDVSGQLYAVDLVAPSGDIAQPQPIGASSFKLPRHARLTPVLLGEGLIRVYAVGMDQYVYRIDRLSGSTWGDWQRDTSAFQAPPGAPIGVAEAGGGQHDLFVVSLDGEIFWRPSTVKATVGNATYVQENPEWGAIRRTGATPRTAISCIRRGRDSIAIFFSRETVKPLDDLDPSDPNHKWRDPDNGVPRDEYTASLIMGEFSWNPVGEVQVLEFDTIVVKYPGAKTIPITRSEGTGVFLPGFGKREWKWTTLLDAIPPFTSVSAVSCSADALDLFFIGRDNTLQQGHYTPLFGGGWIWATLQDTPPQASYFEGEVPQLVPVSSISVDRGEIMVILPTSSGRIKATRWYKDPMNPSSFTSWWDLNGYGNNNIRTGMSDPRVGEWSHVGQHEEASGMSRECTMMTTDGRYWFLASNFLPPDSMDIIDTVGTWLAEAFGGSSGDTFNQHELLLVYNVDFSEYGYASISPVGTSHLGAGQTFEGYLYLPQQHPYGVIKIYYNDQPGFSGWHGKRILLEGSESAQWGAQYFASQRDIFPWVAVNPLNGRLYTSSYKPHVHDVPTLLAYDKDTLVRCVEDDITLEYLPTDIQAGAFTPHGKLVLVSGHDYSGNPFGGEPYNNWIDCFSAVTGKALGSIDFMQRAEAHTGAELEGVTVCPLIVKGQRVDLHVLELDNALMNTDDAYIHYYAVPEPELF